MKLNVILLILAVLSLTTEVQSASHGQSHGHSGGGTPKMGRLRTSGFEIYGAGGPATYDGRSQGSPTLDTATFRSGASSIQFNSGSPSGLRNYQFSLETGEQTASTVAHYVRFYANFTSFPSSAIVIFEWNTAGGVPAGLKIDGSGQLSLWNLATATQIGSAAVLQTGAWYRIETQITMGTGADGTAELQVDGVSIASGTGLNFTIINPVNGVLMGWMTAPDANKVWNMDDFAWNVNTGGTQNSWPGSGKIVLLKPISDNAVGAGWVDGDGAGTLFGSVDNTPPLGAATPADGTQIKNLTSTTVGNYDANMTTYATAGIAATDTITLVQALCEHAEAVTTGTKAGALQIVSNPAQAVEDAFVYGDDGATTMGAWPAGWVGVWGTPQYAPVVTLATSPVLRVGKRTATTREVDVDNMMIYVEYVSPTVAAAAPRLALLGVGR